MIAVAELLARLLPCALLTIGDVRQGVADREAAVRGLALSAHLDSFIRPDGKTDELRGSEELRVGLEVSGRIRYEASGRIWERTGERQEKVIGVYNGTEARSMRSLGAERFIVGEVDRNRSDLYLRLDPREFVTTFFGKPVGVELASPNAALVGTEEWDGRPAQVVEVDRGRGVDNVFRKSRFLIDPSRGFAVVRRSMLARPASTANWIEYYHANGVDHREILPGIWLPMLAEVITRQFRDTNNSEGPVILRYNIAIHTWRVNPEFDDSAFTLRFANGVNVTDRITGRNYRAQRISDQTLGDQLSMETRHFGSRSASRRWHLIGLNGVLAIVVGIVFYHRWSRNASKDNDRP